MIAAIPDPKASKILHVVFWTGRKGLKAISTSYCGGEFNAGDGVVQVTEALLQGQQVATPEGQFMCCPKCKEALGS